jgi:hypothetical protein
MADAGAGQQAVGLGDHDRDWDVQLVGSRGAQSFPQRLDESLEHLLCRRVRRFDLLEHRAICRGPDRPQREWVDNEHDSLGVGEELRIGQLLGTLHHFAP